MNAIYNPYAVNRRGAAVVHSDPRTELARHCFDLRVHAVIMLFNTMMLAYCGFRVLNVADDFMPTEARWITIPHDPLSFCVLAIFIAIAALCLAEARRAWREATTIMHGKVPQRFGERDC
jgi:hypothetical protein